MRRKRQLLLFIMIFVLINLVACSSEIKYLEQSGFFSEGNNAPIEYKYTNNISEGFYSTINFALSSGKVTWGIYNPKGELKYEGYAFVRDGKTIRALTYPVYTDNKELNAESEQIDALTFDYLQFDANNPTVEYRLAMKPISAKGSYVIKWYNRLPKK